MERVTLVRSRPYFYSSREDRDFTHRIDVYQSRQKVAEIHRQTDGEGGFWYWASKRMPGDWYQHKGTMLSVRSALRVLFPEV